MTDNLDPDPGVVAVLEERRELIRRCAERTVRNHVSGERKAEPPVLQWARQVLRQTPKLARELGPGDR